MRRSAGIFVGVLVLSWVGDYAVAQGDLPPPAPPGELPAPRVSVPPPPPRPAQFPEGERVSPAQLVAPVTDSPDQPPPFLPDEIQRCTVECCNAPEGYFIAGGGFYLIQPYFTSNPMGVYRSVSGITVTRMERDFPHRMDVSPLAWLGYISENGLGFRVRYFQFCADSRDSFNVPKGTSFTSAAPLGLPINAGEDEGFAAASDLMLSVWDFEATKLWRSCNWGILGAAGIRYAHIAQDYLAASSGIVGGANAEYLDSGHNFNGAGPTVAVDVKRLFGNTGFALYGNARGSLLFGSAHQRVFREVTSSTTGLPLLLDESASFQAAVLPVGELELGAEYRRDLGRADFLVQLGLFGQVWWGAGNAANSSILSGNSFHADNAANLGFIGMAFRFGVNF